MGEAHSGGLISGDAGERGQQDLALMVRIKAGDPTALSVVLERYWSPLVAYARRILSDKDAAEDIVQETMVRLWNQRSEWIPSQQLQAFLYRIARNLALNEQKRSRLRSEWVLRSVGEPPESPPTPLQVVETGQLRASISLAIDALPPKRREVFILARYHGHSYKVIAEIMNISPQTVANQMSAALSDLRESLRSQVSGSSKSDGRTVRLGRGPTV